MPIVATDNSQADRSNADEPPPETLDERRRRWIHLLHNQHYEALISDILNDELPKYVNSRVIDQTDLVSHMRECALILASASRILTAAVEGTLVSRMLHDTDLQAEHATIQQRARHQPSIYIHLLADEHGNAPTPNQYLLIRDTIQAYMSEGECSHAHHIDNITPPKVPPSSSASGHRKYLCTPRTPRSPTRLTTLRRFCTGITLRHAQTPAHLHTTPFPFPPGEVGYTHNAALRLSQHRLHHSSNALLNLVEDTCTHLFRDALLAQHFRPRQFVVFLVFRPAQAALAEIVVSALLQAWVEGGGLNAFPAGRSVASVRRVGRGDWVRFGGWARRGGLGERMGGLVGRAEVWRGALRWEGEVEGGREGEEEGGEGVV